jgi:hypothetical protein
MKCNCEYCSKARVNGSTQCDTNDGPCACGAWHKPADLDVISNPNLAITGHMLYVKEK